ncbi:hypothetical protein ABMA28_012521 [Loxostege sticticalis]|uniref:MADF domain-containing protein n=1 Tax=Loxostege sticticalis TaxID=481309 RepID=A0ABD0S439_LOXSC
MDAIDVVDLIAEVQKRSPLYDTTLKEYHDVNEKKKLWYQICQIIYTPAVWDGLSSNEKTKYGKNLQKKWATLRRGFRRELALQKSDPSGSAAKKRKKYIYFDALLFLLPFTTLEDNETSWDNEDNETTLEKGNHSANQNLEDNVECSVPKSKTRLHSTNSNKNYDEEIRKVLNEGNQSIFTNTHKVTDPVTNKTDDDDEAFLKSLLPSIKPFTSDEKLLLRIEIMKTILNFKKSINYTATRRASSSSDS